MNKLISLLVCVLILSGCATTRNVGSPQAGSATADERTRSELMEVFEASDQQSLANDPLGALGRGDLRYAQQFGDYITSEHVSKLESQARDIHKRLMGINRDLLPATDRISFDVFSYQQEFIRRGFDSGATEILRRLPLDPLFGYHVAFPSMSSGQSIAPFETVQDYENGLSRLTGFVTYLRRAEQAMREGVASGHTLPRFAAVQVIDQLRAAIDRGVEDSQLVKPTNNFLEAIGADDAERLTVAYRRRVEDVVLPAYRQLAGFMETVYLPACRSEATGLSQMNDGEALYRFLVEQHTGMTLPPDAIHRIGLDEVARIRGEMAAIQRQAGIDGTLQDFFTYLRSNRKFQFTSTEALIAGYEEIRARVEPVLPKLFSTLPRGTFDIRPVPESLEKAASGAFYTNGTPDGSRPGVFYVNTYDLPSRTSPTMETLFLHEAVPGHHLQGSLAQENEALPSFMRFGWNTAFIEGWALYAESLGYELGLFQDPIQRFGHLDLEMIRALRLVVDTGLHAKRWSRQQAVDYMLENSSLSRTAVIADVDRYVVWPGQALAYKLGQLTIQRLRSEAEQALGEQFDLRQFHAQVLGSGAIPLPILEAKVKTWIEDQS